MDGHAVKTCVECKAFGRTNLEQTVYPCGLCGQPRCENHSIWVAAHELEQPIQTARLALSPVTEHSQQDPWYTFCGRMSHIPEGISIRHGEGRKVGRMVEEVPEDGRKPGLGMFSRWQVGIVEDGYEKRWVPQHFTPACALAPLMTLVARLSQEEGPPQKILRRLYESGIGPTAVKRPILIKTTFKDLEARAGSTQDSSEIIKYICSRCGVVICLNRHSLFHDQEMFARLVKKPETVLRM